MPNKLKPCPFCGGKADWSNDVGPDDDYYIEFIQCEDCGATTQTEKEWNQRVPSPEVKWMVEAATETLTSAFGKNAKEDKWFMGISSGKTYFANKLKKLEFALVAYREAQHK